MNSTTLTVDYCLPVDKLSYVTVQAFTYPPVTERLCNLASSVARYGSWEFIDHWDDVTQFVHRYIDSKFPSETFDDFLEQCETVLELYWWSRRTLGSRSAGREPTPTQQAGNHNDNGRH